MNIFSGLIAEYIRRHHYRESVQVLCHFMPIRSEEEAGNPEAAEEEIGSDSDIESDSEIDIALEQLQVEEIPDNESVRGAAALPNQPRDLRLMHLRKGFRLSSMCWDE